MCPLPTGSRESRRRDEQLGDGQSPTYARTLSFPPKDVPLVKGDVIARPLSLQDTFGIWNLVVEATPGSWYIAGAGSVTSNQVSALLLLETWSRDSRADRNPLRVGDPPFNRVTATDRRTDGRTVRYTQL